MPQNRTPSTVMREGALQVRRRLKKEKAVARARGSVAVHPSPSSDPSQVLQPKITLPGV
jgi:hypothetical protein